MISPSSPTIFPSLYHHFPSFPTIFPSFYHHIPIIFPGCSHHLPIILPSCSHHFRMMFPSSPTIFPSFYHHLPIILPSSSHVLPAIHLFPCAARQGDVEALLEALGIPFVHAPAEAEAQCAFLAEAEWRGLAMGSRARGFHQWFIRDISKLGNLQFHLGLQVIYHDISIVFMGS